MWRRITAKLKKTSQKVLYADVPQTGLRRFWTHSTVGFRHFSKDYNVPIVLTAIFIIFFISIVVLRIQQRASLTNLLADTTTIGGDYDTLQSTDREDEVSASDDTDLPIPAGSPTSTSFNSGEDTTTQPTDTTPSGTNGGTNDGTNGNTGGGGSTPQPFAASVASFQQTDTKLECTTPIPVRVNCSKRYMFTADVRTQNGPGDVTYGWRSNVAAYNEDGSFSASSGRERRTLHKDFLVACRNEGTYSLRLNVFSPNQTQSSTLSVNHHCDDI